MARGPWPRHVCETSYRCCFSWHLASPGHQQPCNWLYKVCRSILWDLSVDQQISNEKGYQHLLWRINTSHTFLRMIYSWLDLSHWPIKTASPGWRKMEFNPTINEVWTSSIMSICVINAEGRATNSLLLYWVDIFQQLKYCHNDIEHRLPLQYACIGNATHTQI